MRKLYLYKGKAPNINDAEYITSIDNDTTSNKIVRYMSAMSTQMQFIKSIDLNNYRINSNTIIIEKIDALFESLMFLITYVIDVDTETNYWRCYHVKNTLCQSDKIILQCEVDLWGSYVPFMNIEQLHVTRCNRNIDMGLYDAPMKTAVENDAQGVADLISKNYTPIYDQDDVGIKKNPTFNNMLYAHFSNFYVVAYLSISNTELGGQYQFSFAMPLAIRLDELLNNITNLDELLTTYRTPLSIVNNMIGGIYQTHNNQNKVKVLKCYILPKEAIEIYSSGSNAVYNYDFDTRSIVFTGSIKFYFIKESASKYMRRIDKDFLQIDINRKYFAGVVDKGINYNIFTKNDILLYNFIIKSDGIQVLIEQGDNTCDISTSFELAITTESMGASDIERATHYTHLVANMLNTAINIKSYSSAFGAGLKMADTIMAEIGVKNDAPNLLSDGDANKTYLWGWTGAQDYLHYLMWPYYFTSQKGITNIKEMTRKYGATFNKIVFDYSSIFTAELLGELENEETAQEYSATYIKADDIIIENVPKDAYDFIINKFNSGIELQPLPILRS